MADGHCSWLNDLPADRTKQDVWPPLNKAAYFDWHSWPTNEAYRDPNASTENFASSFAGARKKLDYSYHKNPVIARQELQDAILSRVVQATPPGTPSDPWIVFTAGAMGVGKGYVLSSLALKKRFPLEAFLKIDPDMIKTELPEMTGYLQVDPESAATKVHRESTQMADILFEHALEHGLPILVDGSLRDVKYHEFLFDRIRTEFPQYRIGILHVTASRDAIHARAKDRAKKTGRAVPPALLDESIAQVPRSVAALGPLADLVTVVSNDDGAPLHLQSLAFPRKAADGQTTGIELPTWEDFRRAWMGDTATDEVPPDIMDRTESMVLSWDDEELQAKALENWGKAYPNACARCTLASDGQCGVCVHARHLCACEICAAACPLRNADKGQE